MLRLLVLPLLAALLLACGSSKSSSSAAAPGGAAPDLASVTPVPCPTPQAGERAASFKLSATTIKPGDTITATGSGFGPNATITAYGVQGNLCLPLGSGSADSKGGFSQSRQIGAIAPPGTYQVLVKDNQGHSATAQVTLAP